MSPLFLLAIVGIIEALVCLIRYRTAVAKSYIVSAFSTLGVTVMRISFLLVGVSAIMQEHHPLMLVAAYVIPATVATAILHRELERREDKQ